jgi:hypothetical protein
MLGNLRRSDWWKKKRCRHLGSVLYSCRNSKWQTKQWHENCRSCLFGRKQRSSSIIFRISVWILLRTLEAKSGVKLLRYDWILAQYIWKYTSTIVSYTSVRRYDPYVSLLHFLWRPSHHPCRSCNKQRQQQRLASSLGKPITSSLDYYESSLPSFLSLFSGQLHHIQPCFRDFSLWLFWPWPLF